MGTPYGTHHKRHVVWARNPFQAYPAGSTPFVCQTWTSNFMRPQWSCKHRGFYEKRNADLIDNLFTRTRSSEIRMHFKKIRVALRCS